MVVAAATQCMMTKRTTHKINIEYASNLITHARRGIQSCVSSDENQAEPTIQTGGGFGKGPAHSHLKAVCYPTQTSPPFPSISMANGMHAHPSSWHFALFA